MRARRLTLLLLFASVSLVAAAWAAGANSSGAPEGANKTGCTCHSASPSLIARVQLDGVPKEYTPGQTYNLTLQITGSAPQGVTNQGGFAVGASAGNFKVVDDHAQLRKAMITHTTVGNDQRSWKFTWTAPANGSSPVKFDYAGNAVNGDNAADPADQWASGSASTTLGAHATNSTTPTPAPTASSGKSPPLGLAFSIVAVAAAVALRRRA